jgi:ectoine hydroxylase-related dioxygenase (phytanoyl-CoA dioxygenase family)
MSAALHQLNTQFEWQPCRSGPYRILSEEQARSYDEQGFFLLEDVFDPATLEGVIAEIDPIEAQVEAFLQTREDGKLFIARAGEITFATHLVTRSQKLREFVSDKAFQDITHDVIGDDVRLYWDQAVYKKPGADDPFPWHQDNGYTYIEPQQYLTCWVPLVDATEENGCPWVIPGEHLRGTLDHRTTDLGFVCWEETPEKAVCVEARAGSVVVFSSLTPHATGPNCTDGIRKSYIVQFAPDGAVNVRPHTDGNIERVPCDAPERQFPVLVGGQPPG